MEKVSKASLEKEAKKGNIDHVKRIFELVPIAMVLFGQDFKILDCNMESVHMFGFNEKKECIAELRRQLLAQEGVEFKPCGRVDMKNFNHNL